MNRSERRGELVAGGGVILGIVAVMVLVVLAGQAVSPSVFGVGIAIALVAAVVAVLVGLMYFVIRVQRGAHW